MKMQRRWKILLWSSAFIALVAVYGVGTHMRAKRAVQRYRSQLAAQGEKLTVGELAPRRPTNGFNGAADLLTACNMCSSGAYEYWPSARKYVVSGRARVAWQQGVLGGSKATNVWPWLARYFETNRQALADVRAVGKSGSVFQSRLFPRNQCLVWPSPHIKGRQPKALRSSAL